MESSLKFALAFAAGTLAVVGLVSGSNALVDPFGMYRGFDVAGFNTHKPATYQRVRLLKAYELRHLKPEAIVLGSSRSHIALRPAHEGWNAAPGLRYNLAFDGATTREMYHYLLHAHAVHPLRQVVLGLDTYHAGPGPTGSRPGFDTSVLDVPGSPVNGPRRLLADLRLLASVGTLKASLDTLAGQSDAAPRWLAPDGQRLGEVFFHNVSGTFLDAGPRAYFEEIDRLEVGFQTEWLRPTEGRKSKPDAPPNPEESSLTYILRIARFCRSEGIDLRILITPSHAHQLEIAATVSGWEAAAEHNKRALVELLAREAAGHPGADPFPLYDFSTYSAVTTEALPPAGSRTEMAYYWDSSHFKENVGDLVLDRIFGLRPAGRTMPEDFGVLLTPETIEPALARARQARQAYRSAHPAEIAAIKSWVAEVLSPAHSGASSAANGIRPETPSPNAGRG